MTAVSQRTIPAPTADDRVLRATREKSPSPGSRHDHAGWTAVGWFGLLLAVIGLTDVGLYFYPPAFGSAEWEFATVAAAFSSLPLATVGFAAAVGWLLVKGSRGFRIAGAAVLLIITALVALGYVLFLLNLPLALSAAAGPQGPAIQRAIIRTSVMGIGFGSAYLISAIALLRSHSPREGS